jgi:hypothetical protein
MAKVQVLAGQTIIDIAMQCLGNADKAFELALLNGLAITDDIEPGTYLELPAVELDNTKVASYFTKTGLKPSSSFFNPGGIEFWGIEYDFVIS